MDGFYVAKIQKLSDKRPEDTIEEPKEVPDMEEIVVEAEDKKDAKPETKGHKTTKGKKRTVEDERKAEKRRKKGAKISFPPVQKQGGKKKSSMPR